jgi:hypothetical protein
MRAPLRPLLFCSCLVLAVSALAPTRASAAPRPLGALLDQIRRHQPLDVADLAGASALELRVLRNAVFAARGQTFKSPELAAFFSGFTWYDPRVAAVPESALDPADRANLELLRPAEAARPGGAGAPQWDLMLLLVRLDDGRGLKPVGEEAALIGTWTELVPAPEDPKMQVWSHLDFFPSGFATRRWENCQGGRLVLVGTWGARPGEASVRWFAELRAEGGRSSPRGAGECPEWEEAPAAKLLPMHQQEVMALSKASKNATGALERSFAGRTMVRDAPLPRPENFEIEALRP